MVFPIALVLAGVQLFAKNNAEAANAKALNKAQKQFEQLTVRSANADLVAGYRSVSSRRAQERLSITQSIEQITLDATRRAGAASVAAGESNLHGHSVAAVLNDFHITQMKNERHLMMTEQFAQDQYEADVTALRSQAESRILMSKQTRAPDPNYLQNFLDATASYLKMSSQFDKTPDLPARGFNTTKLSTPPVQVHTPGIGPGGPTVPTG